MALVDLLREAERCIEGESSGVFSGEGIGEGGFGISDTVFVACLVELSGVEVICVGGCL